MSELSTLTDNELILKIKNDCCSKSFEELINRHENLYYSTIHKFYKKNPNLNLEDLLDDLFIVFNEAVEKFDNNKNTKFSTFLYYYSYWHCLNNNKNYNKTVTYENKNIDLINESNNRYINFKNNTEEINDYIFKILDKLDDKRISKIFYLRYIEGNKNKLMSWSEIGKKMNLSTSHIINLATKGRRILFNKLNHKNIIDKV